MDSSKNAQVSFIEKPQFKIISSQSYEHCFLIHILSDNAFKDTIGNRAYSLCIEIHLKLHIHFKSKKKDDIYTPVQCSVLEYVLKELTSNLTSNCDSLHRKL